MVDQAGEVGVQPAQQAQALPFIVADFEDPRLEGHIVAATRATPRGFERREEVLGHDGIPVKLGEHRTTNGDRRFLDHEAYGVAQVRPEARALAGHASLVHGDEVGPQVASGGGEVPALGLERGTRLDRVHDRDGPRGAGGGCVQRAQRSLGDEVALAVVRDEDDVLLRRIRRLRPLRRRPHLWPEEGNQKQIEDGGNVQADQRREGPRPATGRQQRDVREQNQGARRDAVAAAIPQAELIGHGALGRLIHDNVSSRT